MKKIMFLLFLIFVSTAFATTIYDIQYTTDPGPDGTYPSPMDGQIVTVTGIVTGENYNQDNKFFMSDPGGGAWHGIYVYDYTAGPALGDEVEVTGTVSEYYGLTELGYCTITVLSSGNPVPDPLQVTTLDLVVPALAEPYEGCLVSVSNVVVTAEQNNYGEWYVDDGSGECQVDDGFFYLDSVTPPIVITVGMEWMEIIGCLDYSYDEYGLNPRTPDDLIDTIPLVADFSADPLTGNAPLEVNFTDESTGNITSWEWDFDNDGSIDSSEENPTYIYDVVGTYTVSLTVGDGSTTDTETKVDYIVVETDLDADFSADPQSGYAPLEVAFTDLSTGNVTSWEWDFDNDGSIDSDEQNPVYEYTTTGIYTVVLTVSDGANSDTETKIDYITVGEGVVADFHADPLSGNSPLEVQFSDDSIGPVTSWEWDFDNDGSIDSDEQNPVHIYSEGGLYTVSLTVSDGTITDTRTRVDYIEVIAVGTGNILSSLNSLDQNYPNPFNPVTEISFQIADGDTGELTIYNSNGQLLQSKSFDSGTHQFEWNAESQSSGIYLYQLKTGSFSETRKMILLK
ncbi:MAG: PKD domain-containing protein [Candidatus Cloacimonetes bacterium]|nr:PKD domain-containing protein [Candidatus Cloacimonadota bacterium]MCF7813713.1 PKD domain-containing protein [Candidatus Cloacimonadota bacterium]MCF7867779.1 PKD domain-containing protein [Candidatus Cloacimonadota bacterium]MCF7883243.1 PKD domain-containing protein [Candidatus Cloacimonadota bacterium]